MVKHILNIVFICSFVFISLSAQTTEIDSRSVELQNLKDDITRLEAELNEKKSIEQESFQVLDKLNEQSLLLNKLINKLLADERIKESEISNIELQIDSVEKGMIKLKDDYARYVAWIYKQGPNSILKYLTNSESFNQAITRYKYLGYITNKNEKILSELKNKKALLLSLNDQLEIELKQKEILVGQKNREQSILTDKKDEKQQLLVNLKEDQKSIEEEIVEKQRAEIQIKNIIAELVEEERRRLASLKEARMRNQKAPAAFNYNYDNFENFEDLKSNLSWPVAEGSIVRKFGENKNEKLNTVTLNYGVDIKTDSTAAVLAVAEGIVSAINWIPGYGSIVILTHKNEFRTVYGHLSDITIQEGDRIAGGTHIGWIDESLEGTLMHFEIWNERNYQNPEEWLVGR
ncbi:murein hydrolase activator EnvC family protein [Bacteroidota bacterium]